MLSQKRNILAQEVINSFLENKEDYPSIQTINEGSCGEFAFLLNETYKKSDLTPHEVYCTYDFISQTKTSGTCEYLNDWKEDALLSLGVPMTYFHDYKKKVEEIDKRGVVGYHVWLFDGKYHYDSSCLEGVKNPLELPFFQIFTKPL